MKLNDSKPKTTITTIQRLKAAITGCTLVYTVASAVLAQPQDGGGQVPPPGGGQRPAQFDGGFPPDGPGFGGPQGFGGRGGRGGRGPGGFGGVREKQKLTKQFDKDGNGMLDATERQAAYDYLQKGGRDGGGFRGPGGRGGFGGRGGNQEPAQPGPKFALSDAKSFGDMPLYDLKTLRTVFLEFEDSDWEKKMAAFKNTDIEMSATVTVDGKVYKDVGVQFHGMSSFMMVSEGRKRSLNLSLDFVHHDQNIGGYRSLELLNSHEDPSFLRTVLSYQVERDYVPAPKANFMRVVINGENWGIYSNVQLFNKEFAKDWFGTTKGSRWKVPGSPGGRGSLAYLGTNVSQYKAIYEIKSKDDPKAWTDLINLCKVLNETPADKLEAALSPILDIDGALKFLALENTLINNDGYWIRTSDYVIYEDLKGKFQMIPRDSNETFLRPEGGGGPGGRGGRGGGRGGPGGFRGPGGDNGGEGPDGGFRGQGRPGENGQVAGGGDGPQGRGGPGGFGGFGGPGMGGRGNVKGVELDPLVAVNDSSKPLISKLLAVPSLRAKYLAYTRDIADKWLDWKKLGPLAEQYHTLIAEDVKLDTRKLDSTEDFLDSLTKDTQGRGFGPGGGGTIALKNFADQRRAYLLNYSETKRSETPKAVN